MFSFLLKLFLPAFAFGCGLYAAHHWDEGDVRALQLKVATVARDDARAKTLAVAEAADRLKRADAISLNAAVAEAAAQQKLAIEESRTLQEIQRHVSPRSRLCISYGLVRVLDAASLGADPDDLPLPAGKSDGACAPITAADLAKSVAANYAAARANAEQLDALEAWTSAQAVAGATH